MLYPFYLIILIQLAKNMFFLKSVMEILKVSVLIFILKLKRMFISVVHSLCPCNLFIVIAKQILTGNCSRLNLRGKFFRIRDILWMNADSLLPQPVNMIPAAPATLFYYIILVGSDYKEALWVHQLLVIPYGWGSQETILLRNWIMNDFNLVHNRLIVQK